MPKSEKNIDENMGLCYFILRFSAKPKIKRKRSLKMKKKIFAALMAASLAVSGLAVNSVYAEGNTEPFGDTVKYDPSV